MGLSESSGEARVQTAQIGATHRKTAYGAVVSASMNDSEEPQWPRHMMKTTLSRGLFDRDLELSFAADAAGVIDPNATSRLDR